MPLIGGQPSSFYYGSGRGGASGSALATQAIMQGTALKVQSIDRLGQAVTQAAVRIGDTIRQQRQEEEFREGYDQLQKELSDSSNFQTIEARPVDHLPPGSNPLADHINGYGGDLERARADWIRIATSDPSVTPERAGHQFDSMVNPQQIRMPMPGRADKLRQMASALMLTARTPQQMAVAQSMVGAQSAATVTSAGGVADYFRSIWGKNFDAAPGKVDQVALRQAAEERKEDQKARALGMHLEAMKSRRGITGESGARLAQLTRDELKPYHSTIKQSEAAGVSQGVLDEQLKMLQAEGKRSVEGMTFIAPGQEGEVEADIHRIASLLGMDPDKVRERAMGEVFTGETFLSGVKSRLDDVVRPVRGPGAEGAHVPVDMSADPGTPVSASHAIKEWAEANTDELQAMMDRAGIIGLKVDGFLENFDVRISDDGTIQAVDRTGATTGSNVMRMNRVLNQIAEQIQGGIRAGQGTVRKSTSKQRDAARKYTAQELLEGRHLGG